MNADILMPWLEKAKAAFPGERVRVQIELEWRPDGTLANREYDALVHVQNEHCWGTTLDAAFEKAVKAYDPEKARRIARAEELRAKALQIERGEIPA